MKIANEIEMLEITSNILGKPDIIYPTIIHDKDTVILVDTGYPNQLSEFREAFKNVGIPFDSLSKIIITHHDVDHIGSLSSILEQSPTNTVETITHEIEKLYIQGEKRPVKLALLESKLDSLPEQMKTVYKGLKAFYDNCHVNIDKTAADSEELPYCGGIAVIFTPGHTPGHICLYHKSSKTLIAGDCLGVENGVLTTSPSHINFDQNLYINSLKKLTKYDIVSVICYHGGLYRGNVSQRILELINKQ